MGAYALPSDRQFRTNKQIPEKPKLSDEARAIRDFCKKYTVEITMNEDGSHNTKVIENGHGSI